MTETPPSFDEQLAALKAAYAQKLPARVEKIETALQGVLTAKTQDDIIAACEMLMKQAHKLKGSSALYDLPKVSETSGAIERLCLSCLKDEIVPTEVERAELSKLFQHLVRVASSKN